MTTHKVQAAPILQWRLYAQVVGGSLQICPMDMLQKILNIHLKLLVSRLSYQQAQILSNDFHFFHFIFNFFS